MRCTLDRIVLCLCACLLEGCSSLEENQNQASNKQLQCLAEAIHGEARGESEEGKIFVGRVVITRVQKGYGKNYCEVVHAKRQFAPKKNASRASLHAAKTSQKLGPNGITHFHSYQTPRTPLASFSNASSCKLKQKVGGHWGFTCNDYGRRSTASTED